MNALPQAQRRRLEWSFLPVSVLVLAFCFYYTYALAFQAPYPGLTINTEWVVIQVDPCEGRPDWCDGAPLALQTGDQLVSIGSLTLEQYTTDRRLVPFQGYAPGDELQVVYERNGLQRVGRWRMPPVTFQDRLPALRGMVFYLPFWFTGTTVLLLLQPRDERWRLLLFWSYLTAVWLAAGMASSVGVGASSLVLHAVTWLMLPTYLQLHQLVPTPVLPWAGKRTRAVLQGFCALMAVLELFQLLPDSVYALALAAAALGSVGLLLWRFVDRGSVSARPATRLMLAGIGLALIPGVALELAPQVLGLRMPGAYTVAGSLAVVSILPLSYTYAIFKRFLGTLEFRVNRLLGAYAFALTYGTAYVVILLIGSQVFADSGSRLILSAFVSVLFILFAPSLYSQAQRIVGRLAYGTEYSPDQIVRAFANRIPAALDTDALSELLTQDVLPALLVRQSVLYSLEEGAGDLIYAHRVDGPPALTQDQVEGLLQSARVYLPVLAEEELPGSGFGLPIAEPGSPAAVTSITPWVRLVVPLRVRNDTVGLWLLGRRDPDDFYPRQDIDLLDALGAQVAVTLHNIHLYGQAQREISERKQAEERLQASLGEKVVLLQEVHHRVKNNLQIISSLLSLQSQSISDGKAREAFQESRDRVRAMSLVHESLYASEDLAQIDMARYVRNQVMHLQAAYSRLSQGVRFEVNVEDISFGIDTGVPCGLLVNELVSNALKHAFPRSNGPVQRDPAIHVGLHRVDPERYVLQVRDNGIGLPPELDMDDPQSLGLQLVRISTDQVEGELELDRSEGSCFTVTFGQQGAGG